MCLFTSFEMKFLWLKSVFTNFSFYFFPNSIPNFVFPLPVLLQFYLFHIFNRLKNNDNKEDELNELDFNAPISNVELDHEMDEEIEILSEIETL